MIREHPILTLLILLFLPVLFFYLTYQFPNFRIYLQRRLLKIPYLGRLLQAHALAKLFRILQITHQAGVTLNRAIDITLLAFNSGLWHQALQALNQAVQEGRKMSSTLAEQTIWPPLCCQFIAQAEEIGELAGSFSQLADWYQQLNNQLSEQLIRLLEPLLLLMNSVMIGGLLLAIYLPMLRLGEVMTT